MKTQKRSVVTGQICNEQESSSLTMAPTISKEKFTPNTTKSPAKIKKEKSQNKRTHKWKESFLVTYKWLRKTDGKLFCVCCSKFPQYSHKSMELVKGFSGNADGFKEETFQRHAKYHVSEKHKKCQEAWDKMGLPIVNTSIPEASQWGKQISKTLNNELCAKFVAANLVCTEAMAGEKFEPILQSYELLGVPVGSTHQNLQGYVLITSS